MTQLLVAVLRVWYSIVNHVILLSARNDAVIGSYTESLVFDLNHVILLTARNNAVIGSCSECDIRL